MTPSTEDFLSAACRWNDEYNGIRYEISWHGRSEYSPEGTWCYYLVISDEQFYPDDWAKLRLKEETKEYLGSWRRHFDYDHFPDLDAHCGWTFGEMTTYLSRDGKEHEQVKVGCDYQHLWDREAGFPYSKSSVEFDAKHSIDLLLKLFPHRRYRCKYSGRYDDLENFYMAQNGAMVHRSNEEKLRADGWTTWLPATQNV